MSAENEYRLNIQDIENFLPHRKPFLLLDRVVEIQPKGDLTDMTKGVGTRVKAQKNISYPEPCFEGHFPGYPIFPGVLIVEAMAQAAAMSLYPFFKGSGLLGTDHGFSCILTRVDGARFRKPVVPGDVLMLFCETKKIKAGLWVFDCWAEVDGQKAAEAEIMAKVTVRNQ